LNEEKLLALDDIPAWLEAIADCKILFMPHAKEAAAASARVMRLIEKYVEKHGNIALSIGSEWMHQDDQGQVDALTLVGDILDSLSCYANKEEE